MLQRNASKRQALRKYTAVDVGELLCFLHCPFSVRGQQAYTPVDVNDTLQQALDGTTVVEFPTMSVSLPVHRDDFLLAPNNIAANVPDPSVDAAVVGAAGAADDDSDDASVGSSSSDGSSSSSDGSSSSSDGSSSDGSTD